MASIGLDLRGREELESRKNYSGVFCSYARRFEKRHLARVLLEIRSLSFVRPDINVWVNHLKRPLTQRCEYQCSAWKLLVSFVSEEAPKVTIESGFLSPRMNDTYPHVTEHGVDTVAVQ